MEPLLWIAPLPISAPHAPTRTEYRLRHPGVAAVSNTGSALYYSLNWKGVHFLAFNSET
jgi:hypothetical protein